MISLPTEKFSNIDTPFYYYDTELLRRTLEAIVKEASQHPDYNVHYAVKANANPKILEIISSYGLGADCVSGNEVLAALESGFPASKIVYAGVAKTDREILIGIDHDIYCFNCESIEELQIIQELAAGRSKKVRVALRINPDVKAHTHANITTGLAENKFGIPMSEMEKAISLTQQMPNIEFIGLHFHIGSQILDVTDFKALAERINQLQEQLEPKGITIKDINVGGGLGIDYTNPEANAIPGFKEYFAAFSENLNLRESQQVHFELGRSVVGQMGALIARTIFIKKGTSKDFCIIDAGMTDLIRPALYGALHKIKNLSSSAETKHTYDIVGPICESSDVFAKSYEMAETKRGDLIAIMSAGAYGEVMASQYNCRNLPKGYTTEDLI